MAQERCLGAFGACARAANIVVQRVPRYPLCLHILDRNILVTCQIMAFGFPAILETRKIFPAIMLESSTQSPQPPEMRGLNSRLITLGIFAICCQA